MLTDKLHRYVVFLRGINVGGNKKVSMQYLKRVFVNLGFTNVQTLLASGNVVFDSPKGNPVELQTAIENK